VTSPVTLALPTDPLPKCGRIMMRLTRDTARLCGMALIDGACFRHGKPLPEGVPDPLLTLPIGFRRELWEHEWIERAARGMWPPPGYRYVWVDDLIADPDWRVATEEERASKRCRHMVNRGLGPAKACGQPPVVALMRRLRRRGKSDARVAWFYCGRHTFGHKWVPAHLDVEPAHLLAAHLVEGESETQRKVAAARNRLREADTS
jgi:hypothetical protein